MTYKVLVVDDSSFFRRRVTEILNTDSNITVIDVATNGIEAVEKAKELKPDVITMDIEMPVLNGIEAVKQIMEQCPTAILMFSSLTHQGAKATLEALEAGALDFLPKKFNEIAKTTEDAGKLLRERVLQIARKRVSPLKSPPLARSSNTPNRATTATEKIKQAREERLLSIRERTSQSKPEVASKRGDTQPRKKAQASGKNYKLLAIGTSTGGPIALQKILTQIPANFPVPILLVQHMPATFTNAFANRLNTQCKIQVKEAEDGDVLKPGCAYLAPGGRQMLLDGTENSPKLKIREDNSDRISFKPSVDITFGSAAKVFSGSVLGVILTGMGSDGTEGARMLKGKGSTIWAQDEASCVVYGMPQAVDKAGITSMSVPLNEMACNIMVEIEHG